MAKISLLTIGTRGDVEPFLALGLALKAAGHSVRLAAPDNFRDWVESHDVEFYPMGVDLEAFMQSESVRKIVSGQWLGIFKIWREKIIPFTRQTLKATLEAARDADLIIYHPKAYGSVDVAEYNGAKLICASPIPIFPTQEFPVLVTTRDYGNIFNKLSYKLISFSRLPYKSEINRWRRETMGLGRGSMIGQIGWFKNRWIPRLCAVSPAVVPKPGDWDHDCHMTGYWFLDHAPDAKVENWDCPPALSSFLEKSSSAVVYFGFGSMTVADPQKIAQTIADVAQELGISAVIASGWAKLEALNLPECVYVLDRAPHSKLFPMMTAVVHHGGAGTTAAGLRSGRPTLVCPAGVDQPFWGARIKALGAGPAPLPLKDFSPNLLKSKLRELIQTESFATKAALLASKIEAESGLDVALSIIEHELTSGPDLLQN